MTQQAKHISGQLSDPNSEAFYVELIGNKAARDQWSDFLVPKTDAGKVRFARKCLDLVRNFNRNRAAAAISRAGEA